MPLRSVAVCMLGFVALCRCTFAATGCELNGLRIFLQNPAQNAVLLEGAPVAFAVSVLDACGNPVTPLNSTKVQLIFNDGEPEVVLTHVAKGFYRGIWVPRQTGGVRFSIFAFLVRNSGVVGMRMDGTVFTVIEHAPTPTLQSDATSIPIVLPFSSTSVSRGFRIANPSAGDIPFSAAVLQAPGESWLSLPFTAGTIGAFSSEPRSLTITPGSLPAGSYKATIQLTYQGGPPLLIPVLLNLTGRKSNLLLSQPSLTFQSVGAAVEPPQTLSVLAVGSGALTWTATATTLSGGGWLGISTAQGTSDPGDLTPPQITLFADPAGLAPGDYYGRVRVIAPGASNSPQIATVLLRVLKPGSTPSPVIRPTGLVFVAPPGGPDPAPQTIVTYRFDASPSPLSGFSSTYDGGGWLADPVIAAPSAAAAGASVQAALSGLTPGVRTGSINLASGSFTAKVPVVSVVGDGGGKSAAHEAGGCSLSSLQITPLSVLDGGEVTIAQSSALQMKVTDNCGALVTTGTVGVSFSTKDLVQTLSPVGSGVWGGYWTPAATTQTTCLMSITAVKFVGITPYFGQMDLTVTLKNGLNRPQITPGAILNAADFQSDGTAAPGSLITIFGSNLAAGATQATSPVLPQVLGDTQVQLGDQPLPLLYASGGQVNAQIPYDAPSDAPLQLSVVRNSTISAPEPLSIAGVQPAIFSINGNGLGQGAILNASSFTLADSGHAVKAGDVIAIYCTGLGAVNSPVDLGAPSPPDRLIATVNAASVSIGGLSAVVNFAGLAPGFIGLYQVNAVVPSGVAAGNAVPVTITSGNRISPPVTISVR